MTTFYKSLAARGMEESEIAVLDPQGNLLIDADPKTNGETYKRNPEVIGKLNLAAKGVEAYSIDADEKPYKLHPPGDPVTGVLSNLFPFV